MTFGEVKVAEFEHLPVFFPDNRELWEKVFSGQALTEDGKYAQRSRPEVLLAISRELTRPWASHFMGSECLALELRLPRDYK